MVYHRAADSPKMQYCLKIVRDNVLAKIIVHVGMPFLQLHADMKPDERKHAEDTWNDPNSEQYLFLISIQTAGASLNIHKACCNMVIVDFPQSIPMLV
ncbi:hypothetical protein AJ80_06432 [Polytolypa hystricis UAMH7299]|uniref:Helicase C-terminal domain-containing protein n=1 Tax=Polytolypa hystricis (strain UAMH7299) TaxID=1447883 RepID=A0A2B7XVF3_POLH7|nr:hypothetical protein AJ80_06432 [Polytolypa hystricis UAMH7299]